jgi:hypothetical protein
MQAPGRRSSNGGYVFRNPSGLGSSSSLGRVALPNSLRMSGASVLSFGLSIPHIYLELDQELRANMVRLTKESKQRMASRSHAT